MTIKMNDGTCDKVARMVHKVQPDRSADLDLALELHKLAEAYMEATGENYSTSVNRVLSQDRTLREAYARYSHHNGSMSIALPICSDESEGTRHDVSEMILRLAEDVMRQTGIKNLSAATRIVLRERPELAQAYAKLTSA